MGTVSEWKMMEYSSGGDHFINNTRDLLDHPIKAGDLQQALLLTPKLSSTSNATRNPAVLPFNYPHHHQMLSVVTSSQRGRSISDCLYKQPVAAAAPTRRCRWNPSPEHIRALKDLYQSGMKIPTAQQIRQVTARLRNYGKIEGKNVYYWFQNHRARERQRKRHELLTMGLSSTDYSKPTLTNNKAGLQDKYSQGVDFVGRLEDEDSKQNKWTLTNCTGHSDEVNIYEAKSQESSPVREFEERMKRSSSRSLVEQSASPGNAPATLTCTKPLEFQHYYDYDYGMVLTGPRFPEEEEEEESRETQTLELFPLKSDNLKATKLASAALLGDNVHLFL